jgi:hypothetical protein
MADITGRVRKKAADILEPGEHVIAALLVEPKGTYGVGSIAIAALPRTAVRMLGDRSVGDAGLAATFPSGSAALAVTDRRVVVIPSNGLGFREIAVAYDRADLVVASDVSKGLGRRLTLEFVDGTEVVVDAQRGQPIAEFAAAVGR